MAADLRGGAALILASLAAEGTTEISRIYHIELTQELILLQLQLLEEQQRLIMVIPHI